MWKLRRPCWLRGHEPSRRTERGVITWSCARCLRELGTTRLLPDEKLLASLRAQALRAECQRRVAEYQTLRRVS